MELESVIAAHRLVFEMELHHLRNATALLTLGEHRLLIDPMLSEVGSLAGFKLFGGGRRRNPLVALPTDAAAVMEQATAVLVTHEHPDHLDVPAIRWIRAHHLPVWASAVDAPYLERKGLDVRVVGDEAMDLAVEVIAARHGHGLIGWLMGPVSSFYLTHPDEPSILITGDAVLTDELMAAIERLQPGVILAPAGAANFGAGGDILFSVDELVTLVKQTSAMVVFNHLEALDHCPTRRRDLRRIMADQGLDSRVYIPDDGEQRSFEKSHDTERAAVRTKVAEKRKPGFQKWLTAKFAGT